MAKSGITSFGKAETKILTHLFISKRGYTKKITRVLITEYQRTRFETISKDGNIIYTRKITEIVSNIHTANKGKDIVNKIDMKFVDQKDNIKVLYVFRNIYGWEDESSDTINGTKKQGQLINASAF